MNNIFLIVAIQILGFAIIYLILRRRISKSLDSGLLLSKIRGELNRIIVELNQTTEQNIRLIEDRINQLTQVLNQTDKKISLLKKEKEKQEVSTKVYNQILSNPKKDVEKESLKETVLKLYRSGFSSTVIANRVGVSMGEVELIISLEEQKGK